MESRPVNDHDGDSLRLILAQDHVHTAGDSWDPLLTKVATIRAEGPGKLLVISDFDHTISKFHVNGSKGYTSYAIVENSSLMPQEYREATFALRDKYAPIEFNKNLPLVEHVQAMEKWWRGAHHLLLEFKLQKSSLEKMVAEANIALRDGCEEFFSMVEQADVPFLIFSAGLGDTLLEVFKQLSSLRSNMTVLSNFLHFDPSGTACGESEPLIHSYSKGKCPEQFASVAAEIKGRHNVILVGDSLGDPHMAEGLSTLNCVIRIGFLNHNEEDLLATYLQLYDIVLTGDCSMEVVVAVLQSALSQTAD